MREDIPKDPVMLLSFINLKLRDECPSLDDLCKSYDLDKADLTARLAAIDYAYQPDRNQFV